jgi:DnaK suppressor protein
MDTEKLNEHIAIEISKLEKKVKNYTELTKPIAPENSIGRVSRMDAINNKSILENALRNASDRFQKLRIMKDQLQEDDFGICQKYKSKIPLQRIMLRPESRFCVKCAS